MTRITPCLWFDTEGEEAASFYVSLFKNSRITDVSRYGEAGPRPAGTVMVVSFELDGHSFTALNGGPLFKFTEAISFQVNCKTQDEIDYYWDRLGEGGDPKAQQCGWLKDKYGLSWQVVPGGMDEMLKDADSAGAQRAMNAMMQMKKVDMDALQRAYDGP